MCPPSGPLETILHANFSPWRTFDQYSGTLGLLKPPQSAMTRSVLEVDCSLQFADIQSQPMLYDSKDLKALKETCTSLISSRGTSLRSVSHAIRFISPPPLSVVLFHQHTFCSNHLFLFRAFPSTLIEISVPRMLLPFYCPLRCVVVDGLRYSRIFVSA